MNYRLQYYGTFVETELFQCGIETEVYKMYVGLDQRKVYIIVFR